MKTEQTKLNTDVRTLKKLKLKIKDKLNETNNNFSLKEMI